MASASSSRDTGEGEAPSPPTKRAVLLGLLARETGASLVEIVAATGWLAHTSRAALSRLRTAGEPLAKSTRADGCTTYRLVPVEALAPTPARTSRPRRTKAKADGAS
ncbi:DUF3489 domain-containing protein, partial [Methylobacterium trifolii]